MEGIEKIKNALANRLEKSTEEYKYLYNLKEYNLEQTERILKNLDYKKYNVAKNWCIVGNITLNKVLEIIKDKFEISFYEPTMEAIICRLQNNELVSIVFY